MRIRMLDIDFCLPRQLHARSLWLMAPSHPPALICVDESDLVGRHRSQLRVLIPRLLTENPTPESIRLAARLIDIFPHLAPCVPSRVPRIAIDTVAGIRRAHPIIHSSCDAIAHCIDRTNLLAIDNDEGRLSLLASLGAECTDQRDRLSQVECMWSATTDDVCVQGGTARAPTMC